MRQKSYTNATRDPVTLLLYALTVIAGLGLVAGLMILAPEDNADPDPAAAGATTRRASTPARPRVGDEPFDIAGYRYHPAAAPSAVVVDASLPFTPTDHAFQGKFPPDDRKGNQALIKQSVGVLSGLHSNLTAPVALSLGDHQMRRAVELQWQDARPINGQGDDLVVYEVGTQDAGPEALMLRVRDAQSGAFGPWFYRPASSFMLWPGSNSRGSGHYVIPIDLAGLGVPAGGAIDRLQFANMLPTDRVQGSNNRVVLEVGDNRQHARPAPGPTADFRQFPDGQFDPDPMYVGVVHFE